MLGKSTGAGQEYRPLHAPTVSVSVKRNKKNLDLC